MTRSPSFALVAALKGPAISIMAVMLAAEIWEPGRRWLNQQLMADTAYGSDKVAEGLSKLRHYGIAFHHGHKRGWSLTPSWQQLTLEFGPILLQRLVDNRLLSVDNSVDNPVENPTHPAGDSPIKSDNTAGNPQYSPIKSENTPDHDDDHDDGRDLEKLLDRLRALKPPFDDGRFFIRRYGAGLIRRNLDALDAMPADQRRLLRNEAAFIRDRVRRGYRPPPVAPRPTIPAAYDDIIQR